MRQSKPILQVDDISCSYGDEPVLQNIHFSLQRGEILCLLGRSGSGKTSLLRALAGLEKPETGTIFFDGHDTGPIPAHKRRFGMMFQEYALFPHKNVEQNICFGLEMKKLSREKQQHQVAKMLKLVGLAGLEKRKPDELSGGEQQRVALARCLAPEPDLLLLDEPLGSLDRTLRDRLTVEIRSILKSLNMTAIFVTHDQMEAFSMADKIGILDKGRLCQFDTPERLYRYPVSSTVARFLGFRNLLKGRFDKGNCQFNCALGSFSLVENRAAYADMASSANATLLIRPEGARIAATGNPGQAISNALTGQVISRSYLGSNYRLTLQTGDVALTFELALDPPPPSAGEEITLLLSESALVLV